MYTIWGHAQDITKVAEGITNVSTASHGGYILSQSRMDEMPLQYKVCSYTSDNNFEEDTSWCAVVLAWPEYFKADHINAAQDTYDMCYGSNRRVYSWE